MATNCRRGDLAIVVRQTESTDEEYRGIVKRLMGRFVTVTRSSISSDGKVVWDIRRDIPMRMKGGGKIFVTGIEDELLQPIRGRAAREMETERGDR